MVVKMRAMFVVLLLAAGAAQAQVYRCQSPTGAVEFSDSPCAPNAEPVDNDARREIQRRKDEARVQQERDRDLVERIQREKEAARKHTAERAQEAERLRNEKPAPVTKSQPQVEPRPRNPSAVHCTDLSLYAKAKGHSWMERVAIVDDARRRGNCYND